MQLSTWFYTSLALLAFAGNSVLCRLALAEQAIDASSFSVIRLLSGAITLGILLAVKGRFVLGNSRSHFKTSLFLLLYMLGFSYAYLSLGTATGALILFASVQLSMLLFNLLTGNKLARLELLGLFVALLGLCYLLLPGASAPDVFGFVLMLVAGIAWAGYTLMGRASSQALTDSFWAFLFAVPLVLLWGILLDPSWQLSSNGIVLAILSGAVTSGIGYYLWFLALPGLSVTQAASLQLLVPVIAAIGGVVFSGELLTPELLVASALILGGIGLVIRSQKIKKEPSK